MCPVNDSHALSMALIGDAGWRRIDGLAITNRPSPKVVCFGSRPETVRLLLSSHRECGRAPGDDTISPETAQGGTGHLHTSKPSVSSFKEHKQREPTKILFLVDDTTQRLQLCSVTTSNLEPPFRFWASAS